MHFLHAALGYFVLIVTIVFAIKVNGMEFNMGFHNILGYVCTVVTIFGAFSGMFTAATMKAYKGDKPWSEKERVERVAKIHRIAGYTMLLLGNITVMTGIGYYFNDKLEGDDRKIWGFQSLLLFIVLVGVFEMIYRLRNKYSKG